jgi:hypothetical protein
MIFACWIVLGLSIATCAQDTSCVPANITSNNQNWIFALDIANRNSDYGYDVRLSQIFSGTIVSSGNVICAVSFDGKLLWNYTSPYNINFNSFVVTDDQGIIGDSIYSVSFFFLGRARCTNQIVLEILLCQHFVVADSNSRMISSYSVAIESPIQSGLSKATQSGCVIASHYDPN